MNSQRIIELFQRDTEELKLILQKLYEELQNCYSSSNPEQWLRIKLSLQRIALNWAIELLVFQLVRESQETFVLKPPNFKDSNLIKAELTGLPSYVDAVFNVDSYIKEKTGKIIQNIKESQESPFDLAAIHFRSSLLEDGRATYSSIKSQHIKSLIESLNNQVIIDANETNFLDKLLWTYLSIYSRPLTFNDRILQVCSRYNSEEIQAFLLRFNTDDNSPILENVCLHNSDNSTFTLNIINFPKNVFNSLIFFNNQDVRDFIFKLVSNIDTRPEGRGSHEIIAKLRQKQQQLSGASPFDLLSEAVEITWHQVIAHESSYNQWKNFLTKFQFIQESESSNRWTNLSREGLLESLWFLQGIALYEKLVDGGLLTITFPINLMPTGVDVSAGVTFGFTSSSNILSQQTDNNTENIISLLSRSTSLLSRSLTEIFSSAFQTSELLSSDAKDTNNSELRKEINNNSVFSYFKKEIHENLQLNLETKKADSLLAATLKLCRNISTAVHEQYELQFQFFIGNASELGLFREVYVFQDEERIEFEIFKTKIWSKLLQAHYSYFQQPNIGIFFEIEGRVSPRVIKMTTIQQRLQGLHYLEENIGDDISNRHQAAINFTSKSKILIVCSGVGQVRLYGNGKELLRWPDNDTRGWWVPELTEPWNSEDKLSKLIIKANKKYEGNLTDEKCNLLARAIYWVSSQPGLGCSLVIYNCNSIDTVNKLKERLTIPLNPRKLKWVQKISLSGAQKSYIQNTLIQDGATILDLENCEIEGQQLITPIDQDGRAFNAYNSNPKMTLEEMEIRWIYGTRHTSACDLTKVFAGECLTITVSADGPITVFYEGKAIKELDELENRLSNSNPPK